MTRIALSLHDRIIGILERMKSPCTRGELMALGCHRSKKGETAEDVQESLDELCSEGLVRLVKPFRSLRGPSSRVAYELNERPTIKEPTHEPDEEGLSSKAPIPELIPPPGCQWETGIIIEIPEYQVWDDVERVLKVIPAHSTQPLMGWRDPNVPRTRYNEQGYTCFSIARHAQKARQSRMKRTRVIESDE